ncbi:peptidoglycan-binding domain-containing protein [Streptomyces phaeoluteigriseus]
MRTHGISLVRDRRREKLKEELDRAVDHDQAFTQVLTSTTAAARDPQTPGTAPPPPPAPKLVAEDLVRGHRMDIWDEEHQRWFSLHERDVEYRQPSGGPPLLTASDEGFFQANLISLPPGMGDDKPYVPEQLVTWDGWSLSAPRPGLVLDIDEGSVEAHRPPNQPVEVSNKAMTALPLEITSKVRPGSLPRLRFGHQYRVRLRTVDLAGNGPTLAEADALMEQKDLALPGDGLLVFQRYEAVPAPAVAPRLPLAEGASAFRMVIRSSPGSGPPPAAPPSPPGNEVTVVVLANVQFGETNDDVRTVQEALIAQGHSLVGGADGDFGNQTKAAYAAEQRAQGFKGTNADGNPGCQSLTELGRKGGFAVDCTAGPGAGDDHGASEGRDAGRTAEQYAADFNRSRLVTEEGHLPYQGTDERHVVAPKASLQCVEWHGLLDEAIGSTDQRAQDSVYELAKRESGSLNDPLLPNVQLEPIPSPAADPKNPAVTALHTGGQVDVPYLRDPLGTGAVLLDLPGMPAGEPFVVPWDGDVWHRPRSFRLRLAEGSAPPRFDEASRVLTVSLPKGVVATVRLCSAIDFDESVMGMASWCRELPAPAPGLAPETEDDAAAREAAELRRADHALELAAAGRHWMFTPCQELTLVHAVQQPLKAPVLDLSPLATPRASKRDGRAPRRHHRAGRGQYGPDRPGRGVDRGHGRRAHGPRHAGHGRPGVRPTDGEGEPGRRPRHRTRHPPERHPDLQHQGGRGQGKGGRGRGEGARGSGPDGRGQGEGGFAQDPSRNPEARVRRHQTPEGELPPGGWQQVRGLFPSAVRRGRPECADRTGGGERVLGAE